MTSCWPGSGRARSPALLGFALLDQTRIATATSEIARNAFQYAGGGRVEFIVETGPAPAFVIRVRERGPGIKDLQRSSTASTSRPRAWVWESSAPGG